MYFIIHVCSCELNELTVYDWTSSASNRKYLPQEQEQRHLFWIRVLCSSFRRLVPLFV